MTPDIATTARMTNSDDDNNTTHQCVCIIIFLVQASASNFPGGAFWCIQQYRTAVATSSLICTSDSISISVTQEASRPQVYTSSSKQQRQLSSRYYVKARTVCVAPILSEWLKKDIRRNTSLSQSIYVSQIFPERRREVWTKIKVKKVEVEWRAGKLDLEEWTKTMINVKFYWG